MTLSPQLDGLLCAKCGCYLCYCIISAINFR